MQWLHTFNINDVSITILGNVLYFGNNLDTVAIPTHMATVTTHWNQVINIGASSFPVLESPDCPPSKALLMNTNEMEINLWKSMVIKGTVGTKHSKYYQ